MKKLVITALIALAAITNVLRLNSTSIMARRAAISVASTAMHQAAPYTGRLLNGASLRPSGGPAA